MEYLKVHVGINRHEVALVLATPLQLDNHGFTRELSQKGLWVHGNKLMKTTSILCCCCRL